MLEIIENDGGKMKDYTFLTEAAEKVIDYYQIPGCAMAVAEGGEISFFHFGWADKKSKKKFTEHTVSGIGSCTKSMTAMAVLYLEDHGVLSLDRPVADYIPGFKMWDDTASRAVTLRDMLCHRTGVAGHDGTWPDGSITRPEFLRRIQYMEANRPFRTEAQYSNVMYVAAGGIMEMATGQSWESLLEEIIFRPLGMDHSFCLMKEAEHQGNCAVPYRWDHGICEMPRWNIDMAGPCGSVMSTAEDMSKWLLFHIGDGHAGGKTILKEKSFEDMHRPQVLMDYPHIQGGRSLGYALGWRVLDYKGHIVQQHTGKIEGYSAFQFYLPGTGNGAVFLQNLHAPDNPFIFAMQGLLLDHFLGFPSRDWGKLYTGEGKRAEESAYHELEFRLLPDVTVKGTSLSHNIFDYVGKYSSPAYGIFEVVYEKGRLWLHERDVKYREMTHLYYDTFQVDCIKEDTDLYTVPLTFRTGGLTGKIEGFDILLEPEVKNICFKKI